MTEGRCSALLPIILCRLVSDPHNFLVAADAILDRPRFRGSIVEPRRLARLRDLAPLPAAAPLIWPTLAKP
jgi:hypothetical protein